MTEEYTPGSNLKFLGVGSEQADSGGGEEGDQFAFLDDSAQTEHKAVKEREEQAWAQSEQENLQKWMTEEPSGIDTDGMSNTEFEKHAADLKGEESRNDKRETERAYLKGKGLEIPAHLVEKKPLTADDLKDAPDLADGSADINSMSDEDFSKGIAKLRGEAQGDDDRSASQMLAQQARDADAQIVALQDDLAETYEGYSQEELQEALPGDEKLQIYVAAQTQRGTAFQQTVVTDRAEHTKRDPTYTEAREFLISSRKAELKRAQPNATDAQLSQYIDGEERNISAQAIALGASPSAEIHQLAIARGFVNPKDLADFDATQNKSVENMTPYQRALLDRMYKNDVGETDTDRMTPSGFNKYFNSSRSRQRGVDGDGISELFDSLG